MKILHINTYSSGGAATAAIRLHEALLLQGYDSNFLFLKGTERIKNGHYWDVPLDQPVQKKGFQRRVYEYIKRLVKVVLPKRLYTKKELAVTPLPKIEIFTSPVTNFLIEQHKMVKEADIIQLHWVADFLNWESFFKTIDKPIFWYFHDMNPLLGGIHYTIDQEEIIKSALSIQEKKYNEIKDKAIKDVKNIYIQCDSNWLTQEVLRSGRFSSTEIKTIHYSLDLEVFYPIEKNVAKKILGFSSNKVVILFGCDDLTKKRKGFDLLIKALSLLKKRDKEKVILCTFGEGFGMPPEKNGELNIKHFGSLNNVDFQRLVYSCADFFVIPSRQEAFGQTALESLACGTPVIAFRVGGIPDIVKHLKNGLLAEKVTPEDLSVCVELLINDNDLLSGLRQRARLSILNKFSQQKQVDAFIEIYCKVLKIGYDQFSNEKGLGKFN